MASRNNYTYQRAPSLALQERIVQALIRALADGRGPLSSEAVSAEVFSSVRNVRRNLTHMVGLPRDVRRIRIGAWQRHSRGEPTALYTVGTSSNAPRPAPYTSSELCKRYRATHPELGLQSTLAKRAKRMRVRRDDLTVGLYGESYATTTG